MDVPFLMTLFLCGTGALGVQKSAGSPLTYQHTGPVCQKCPPGTFVFRHCAATSPRPDCRQCHVGTFQRSYSRATRCGTCRTHCEDVHEVVVKNCTRFNDLLCRCAPGYYRHVIKPGFSAWGCLPLSCPEGQIVIQNGTHAQNHVCGDCPSGTVYDGGGGCLEVTTTPTSSSSTTTSTTTCLPSTHTHKQGIGYLDTTATSTGLHENHALLIVLVCVVAAVVVAIVVILLYMVVLRPRSRQNDRHICRHTECEHLGLNRVASDPASEILLPSTDAPDSQLPRQHTRLSQDVTILETTISDPEVWIQDVFLLISKRIGEPWKDFARHLPASIEYTKELEAKMYYAGEHNRQVPAQIYEVLKEWTYQNPDDVTIHNVIRGLEAVTGDENLVLDVVNVYNTCVESGNCTGQHKE